MAVALASLLKVPLGATIQEGGTSKQATSVTPDTVTFRPACQAVRHYLV